MDDQEKVAVDRENSDELDDIQPVGDQEQNTQPGSNIGLIWRLAAVGIALIIIVVLGYPWLQDQLKYAAPDHTPAVISPVATSTPVDPALELAAVEANPDSAKAWFTLGKSYYQAQQWNQAVEAFQKAIELEPGFQAAYANLGAAYHRQERLDLAVSQYQKALELDAQDGEVVYNLAAVYLQQALQSGQPNPELMEQAITQLNRALELTPDSAEPYFALGVAYMTMDQKEDAIRAFETYLNRDSGQDPQASLQAQRYLETLQNQ